MLNATDLQQVKPVFHQVDCGLVNNVKVATNKWTYVIAGSL